MAYSLPPISSRQSLLLLAVLASPAQALNSTLLSQTFTDHGGPNLLCRAADWADVATFFLGNYVAHAATTKSLPGQSALGGLVSVLSGLLFPTSAVLRGFQAIASRAVFADTELRVAARAGALCMVVEDEKQLGSTGTEEVAVRHPIRLLSTTIHGRVWVPRGYNLMVVPKEGKFVNDEVPEPKTFGQKLLAPFRPETERTTKIACNYNLVKVLIAFGQALFASTTLYRTKGNQIDVFGYAAFGLTVAPYIFMSIVNIIGNLMCPDYTAMYLVESQALRNLRGRVALDKAENGQSAKASNDIGLQGTVGFLTDECDYSVSNQTDRKEAPKGRLQKLDESIQKSMPLQLYLILKVFYNLFTIFAIAALAGAVPVSIVAGFSSFRRGSSTYAQRVWTMAWLAFGILSGVDMRGLSNLLENRVYLNRVATVGVGRYSRAFHLTLVLFSSICYSIPAVGGFVVVGQMIRQYGVCTSI